MKLIRAYFETYYNISSLKSQISLNVKSHLFAENAAVSASLVKEKTTKIISDRLIYINEEITALPLSIALHGEEYEYLLLKQKSLLITYFNLFNHIEDA